MLEYDFCNPGEFLQTGTCTVTIFQDVVLDILISTLPITLPVLASIAGVFFSIKFVRRILHI